MNVYFKPNSLQFKKDALVELNDLQTRNIDSGITPAPLVFMMITAMGAGVGVGAAITQITD